MHIVLYAFKFLQNKPLYKPLGIKIDYGIFCVLKSVLRSKLKKKQIYLIIVVYHLNTKATFIGII